MHVRRSQRNVAQAGDFPFAEVLLLQLDVTRRRARRAQRVVIVTPELVVRILPDPVDPAVAAAIDLARGEEKRNAGIGELAVRKQRTEMADVAIALADEEPQAASGADRIACGGVAVASRQRIAKGVEARRDRDQRLLERGERFPRVGRHCVVVDAAWAATEDLGVAARQFAISAQQRRHVVGRDAVLARIGQRANAVRPQAVAAAVPAEPAEEPRVDQRRRIAVDRRQADAGPAPIGEQRRRRMATGAGNPPVSRQTRIEEEPLSQRRRFGLAGDAIAGVRRQRRRPRPVRQDPRPLEFRESEQIAAGTWTLRRRNDAQQRQRSGRRCHEQEHAPVH